jgi:FkbM family methyltransferase
MNNEVMRERILAASSKLTGSRWSRLLRHPVSTLTPYIMRRLGMRRNVTIDTAWGGKFTGILPEAVTSVIWRSGTFELPVSLSLLHFLKPGGSYVDVGAHFGYFSLLASKLVGEGGRVLSIEAMPSTYEYLKRNIELNATHKNVTLFQGAAFSERSEMNFKDFGVVASSLNSAFAARDTGNIIEGQGQTVTVQAHKVDDIVREKSITHVDLVKIDAESSEKFVLIGMSNILSTFKPPIVMEVGDADPSQNSVRQLLNQLADHGYQPYHWDSNQKLQPFATSGYVPYANLVFCHKDRAP